MDRRAVVAYVVPVQVIVNVTKHQIERVVVVDEEIEVDPAGVVRDLGVANYGLADADTAAVAIAVAEDPGTLWPTWEFGF